MNAYSNVDTIANTPYVSSMLAAEVKPLPPRGTDKETPAKQCHRLKIADGRKSARREKYERLFEGLPKAVTTQEFADASKLVKGLPMLRVLEDAGLVKQTGHRGRDMLWRWVA